MDIKPLESNHTIFRRMGMLRGVQTHGLDFCLMNAEWITDRARQRQLKQPWRNMFGKFADPESIQKSSKSIQESIGYDILDVDGEDGDSETDVEKTPEPNASTKRGGGGMQRAFIRSRTLGIKNPPSFSELNRAYRTMFFGIDCCLDGQRFYGWPS